MNHSHPSNRFSIALLTYLVGLKVWLVATARLDWSESFSAILSEIAAASALLVAIALILRWRVWPGRALATMLAFAWTSLSCLQFCVIRSTGTVHDVSSLRHVLMHPAESLPVLQAEIGAIEIVLFLFPIALVLWSLARPAIPSPRFTVAMALVGLASFVMVPRIAPEAAELRRPELARALAVHYLSWRNPSDVEFTELMLPAPGEVHAAWEMRPSDAPRPNVLVYMMEGVRASVLSVYSELETTPFLASLAEKSIVADNCYCQIACTAKSVITTHGGFPCEVTVDYSEPGRLPARGLPHLLGELGYRSAFFFPGVDVHESQELAIKELGFDDYYATERIVREWPAQKAYLVEAGDKRCERADELRMNTVYGIEDRGLNGALRAWIGRDRAKPFYVATMGYQTHHPYLPPPDWAERRFEVEKLPARAEEFARYLDIVAYVDSCLKDLFEGLEQDGVLDDTVVIVTSDHGQAFGEQDGRYGHGTALDEEMIRIPMIVFGHEKWIGRPRRISGVTQNLDVAATIADICGVPGMREQRSPLLGVSLLAGSEPRRKAYLATWLNSDALGVIESLTKQVYNTRFDRFECSDLRTRPAQRIAALRKGSAAFESRRDELLAFKWSIDEWYDAGDRAEIESLRRRTVPTIGKTMNADFGSAVRLARVRADTEVVTNGHLAIDLVFDVRETQVRDCELQVRLRQGDRVSPAPCVRDPNRLPLSAWAKGDVIVLRLLIHCPSYLAEPGDLDIEVAVVDIDADEPLPVRLAGAEGLAPDTKLRVATVRVSGR